MMIKNITLMLTLSLCALSASSAGMVTVMDISFSDNATIDAASMREDVSVAYTGDISFDGPGRRLIFNNVVADISSMYYLFSLTDVYPEGFTIEFHGKNEFTSTSQYRNHFVCSSNLRFVGDRDASFTMTGGGFSNGQIWMKSNASVIFDGGSYTLIPSQSFAAVPILFSGDYTPSQHPTADAATVSLSNIPKKSLVLRECNATFEGLYNAFSGCLGYFGMSNCEVTEDLYTYNDYDGFDYKFAISTTTGQPYRKSFGESNGSIAKMVFERKIPIDAAHFPDSKFRTEIQQYDVHKYACFSGDGYLLPSEFAAVKRLSLASKSINNLQGVEYFTELEQLFCNDNQLTALDVSQNTKLRLLDCYNNRIAALDVSNHESLFRLMCYNNKLQNLVIGNCPALTTLYIYCNRIPFSKMVDLFVALPATSNTTNFRVYDNSNLTEGNIMYDCTELRDAIDRGWTPMQYLNGEWVPFYGITDYSIVVGDVQVTEANMNNVIGTGITGSVTYNPYDNVLTLTNATITAVDCIRLGRTVHGLKIMIAGEVTLNATQRSRPAIIFNNLDGDVIQGITDGDQYAKLNINVPDGNYTTPAIYYISGYGTRCYIKDIDIHITGTAYIGSENWDEKLTVENSSIISEAPSGEFSVIDDVQLVDCYVALPEGGYFNRGQLCNAQGQNHRGPYQILRSQATVTGDVDGSGVVDVDDVNAVINIILGKKQATEFMGVADVDGSGIVDVDDVNAIINIILTQ